MSGFKITNGKGFHITFENGWTVSIQFGWGNYGANYDNEALMYRSDRKVEREIKSNTAEIAAWDKDHKWHEFEDGDTVAGYKSVEDVFEFMQIIQQKEVA